MTSLILPQMGFLMSDWNLIALVLLWLFIALMVRSFARELIILGIVFLALSLGSFCYLLYSYNHVYAPLFGGSAPSLPFLPALLWTIFVVSVICWILKVIFRF